MNRIAAIAAVLTASCWAWAQVSVETIQGDVYSAQSFKLDDNKLEMTVDKKPLSLPVADLAQIAVAPGKQGGQVAGATLLTTSCGDRLVVTKLTMADGKASFDCALAGIFSNVDMSNLREVFLPSSSHSPADVAQQVQAMNLPRTDKDRLLVERKAGVLLSVEGVIKALDAKEAAFEYRGVDGKIDRATIRKIQLASLGKAAEVAGFVAGTDGSELGFTSLTSDGKTLTVENPALGKRTIAMKNVASVVYRSPRVLALAELEPSAVKQHGLLDKTFEYRLNRSVGGGVLTLGDQQYSTGLGLHSFCELTYKLDGQFSQLVAVVGIDDATKGGGNAELTVLLDGKAAPGQPMTLTGKDKPQPLRVELADVKELTIRVDFGADKVDVGDHVNLAAARLIRKPATTDHATTQPQE